MLRRIFDIAQNRTRVVFIPGNHDELLRDWVGETIFGVEIHAEHEHRTRDGRRFLILHGDQFDHVVMSRWFERVIGSALYRVVTYLHRYLSFFRAKLGFPYWSLASYLKNNIQHARRSIDRFAQTASYVAARRGYDGVICGHIHQPEIRRFGSIVYCNDGDWTESCSALVETLAGDLRVINWSDLSGSETEPLIVDEAA